MMYHVRWWHRLSLIDRAKLIKYTWYLICNAQPLSKLPTGYCFSLTIERRKTHCSQSSSASLKLLINRSLLHVVLGLFPMLIVKAFKLKQGADQLTQIRLALQQSDKKVGEMMCFRASFNCRIVAINWMNRTRLQIWNLHIYRSTSSWNFSCWSDACENHPDDFVNYGF